MKHTAKFSVERMGYVRSVAQSGLDTLVCLTELIDNALDAGARNVRVFATNGKELRVVDDGDGVPSMDKLVCFGGHLSHGRRGSGMYGVGFKEAVLCLGGVDSRVRVVTKRGDRKIEGLIDWSRLKDTEECFSWDDGDGIDADVGTTISIKPLRLRFPDGTRRERLIEQLGYVYSPAIKQGAVIQINAGGKVVTLERWSLPELSEVVDAHIEVNGKRARLRAGIVADGQRNDRPGITYSHGQRVIKSASSFGCGSWSINRICGFVELDRSSSWARNKNKTDIVDADDLYEEVERALTPLLQKAAAKSHSIELQLNKGALEAALTTSILGPPELKAKRGRGDTHGTQSPTGKGGKHARARETQPGATFGRRRITEIKLFFADGWRPGEALGTWEVNKTGRVTLYQDHPAVRRSMSPWNADALLFAAMSVVSVSKNLDDSPSMAVVTRHGVLSSLATFTASSVSLDGAAFEKEAAE